MIPRTLFTPEYETFRASADKLFSMVLIEEQARINNSSLGWGLHSEIVAPYLLNYGSAALKKKYLPKMASGEMIGAIAMSEPGEGRQGHQPGRGRHLDEGLCERQAPEGNSRSRRPTWTRA